jgi:hypothetical protein
LYSQPRHVRRRAVWRGAGALAAGAENVRCGPGAPPARSAATPVTELTRRRILRVVAVTS